MAINTELINIESPKLANYFDLSYWSVINTGSGNPGMDPLDAAVVDVYWNAYDRSTVTQQKVNRNTGDLMVDSNGGPLMETVTVLTLVKTLGPFRIRGMALMAVSLESDTVTQAYKAAGVPAALAEAQGQRDAIYHALQLAGQLPTP